MLLALRGDELPDESLQRAEQLCRAMQAELHIVRVLQDRFGERGRLRQFDSNSAVLAIERMRRTRVETTHWFAEQLAFTLAPEKLWLKQGDFVDCASEVAEDLAASLIVVAPRGEHYDGRAEDMAAESGRPVLLARARRKNAEVIAATSLTNARHPVLLHAAAMAELLNTQMVPVHSLSPVAVQLSRAAAALAGGDGVATCDEVTTKEQAMVEVGARFGRATAGVVAIRESAADAILREAEGRAADLVVVGMTRRGRLARLLRPGVASRVVRHARRSVLLAPLSRRAVSTYEVSPAR
ncbi:MAG TPA: universal stress protein [Polyangiales bacterium]|nr:universal stress protein [Polyangiales bacterium]